MSSKGVRLEMMKLLDKAKIIDMHLRGMTNKEIAEELGIHRNTVGKYVREYESHAEALRRCDADDHDAIRVATEAITSAPAYDSSNRGARKWNEGMDAMLDSILADEERKRRELGPNKQMLTKSQIHGLMADAGFDIGLTTVQKKIDLKRKKPGEAFIAQSYEYGDRFEYDFGEVRLKVAGACRKFYLAVMATPASDYRFALLYENQRKQVFIDSQVRFFEHMGGSFREGVYDNMRNVVKKFVGRSEKEVNDDLLKLAAYYGFSVNVTNCFAGNEKGSVERSVEIVRNAAFAVRWEFDDLAQAQAHLDAVLAELNAGKRVDLERAALTYRRPPYEAAELQPESRVDKYSCVTYDKNQYSVPEALVGKKVLVKGYPNEVVIIAGGVEAARHARMPGKGGMSLQICHYLGTLRRKPGAIPNSVALKSAPELKEVYDKHYTERPREFVEILRSCAGEGVERAIDELLASATPAANPASARRADAIAEKARAQISLITYVGGRLRHVG